MLCLVGEQGLGKSSFFRFLALKDEWFSDDLKRMDDENVYRKLGIRLTCTPEYERGKDFV